MPTASKIPQEAKKIGAVAIGRYAIFCEGILVAGEIHDKLAAADQKKGLPAVGYISIKGQKIYYCRYAFVNDKDIYKK